MAYEDAFREVIFLAKSAREMGLGPFVHDSNEPAKNPENAVPICTDSDNAIMLAGQKGYRRATRHYDIKWHIIQPEWKILLGLIVSWIAMILASH